MLSNFIWWSGKRKGKNESRSHHKSPSASASIASSPLVFNIRDTTSLSTTQSPLLVKLNLSGSDEEWFPKDLLRSRGCSPESSPFRAQDAKADEHNLIRANSPPASLPNHSDDPAARAAARKKSIPTPILIPDAELHAPNVQIGHSAVSTVAPAPEMESQPITNDAPLNSPSPSPSDNLSSISGTTLARALIASTFVLPSSERRSSRHRTIVRQDSATLPRRESVPQPNSGRSSPIPPVPPVPTTLASVSSNPNHTCQVGSGASTESEYPMSDSYMTSPEIVVSPPPAAAVSDTASKEKTDPVPICTRAVKNDVFEGPKTAVEPSLFVNTQGRTRHLSQEGSPALSSEAHSLDEFIFVSPEPLIVVASPGSDSSASYTTPLPKRNDTKRKRRFGGSNFFRNGSKDGWDGTLASQHGHSMPSATVSENDYGELLNYDLTVSPGSSSSSQMLSGGSAGYQTFPETPMVFSPLWSPVYAFLSKSDSRVLRTHPRSPKSAGLGSRKLFPGVSTSRKQMDNRFGICGGMSSFLPRQEMLSPGQQSQSNLLPSVQVTDEGVSDETDQLSTNTVESQNIQATVRPHPLARISTSSSCLPEEEALRALARHSSSSLPSFVIDVVGAPPSPMPDRALVIDPSVESPTSCPEPTDGPPSSSSTLVSSATATSSSAIPPQSPPHSATTAVGQPNPSKSPLSSASSPEESSLRSPLPPAPSNEPHSGTLSPMQVSTSSAVSDMSISPSFFPPPPYHAVISERTAHRPVSTSLPSLSSMPPSDNGYKRHRQTSSSSTASGSIRCRGRSRPTPPVGPRKQGQILGSFVPEGHSRNGSISCAGGGTLVDYSGSPWRAIQMAALKPPPKFQMPPPKWRGLTLEAAQWTFTSAQLQEVVSQAIQQSSEGSSIRLLRLEVLGGEVADAMHRLELQHTDLKAQYKALVRKRWALVGALASQMESAENNDASRTMEALAEVLLELDQVADRMHDTVLRMSQLKSLCDVHNASALALAVRKINGLFVRQMAEKERLQGHIDTLVTERDDAWKHAEDIARDYDSLNERMSETVRACGDADLKIDGDAQSSSLKDTSKRSSRIFAVRKLSNRMSRAGLRSRTRQRASTRSSSPAAEDAIPPVPRLPMKSPDGAVLSTGVTLGSTFSCESGTSEALAIAQREVYEMLGLSLPPSRASSRRRIMSVPEERMSMLLRATPLHALGARARPRSAPETLHIHAHAYGRSFLERGRATKSVILERSRFPLGRTMN